MPDAKELKRGDPCPACGAQLEPAHVPTDAEWKKANDRENPQSLPTGSDTASPDQRKELGALYRCTNSKCGYAARFKGEASREDGGEKSAAAEGEDKPKPTSRGSR